MSIIPRCVAIIASGPRKGQECGKPVRDGCEFCGIHNRASAVHAIDQILCPALKKNGVVCEKVAKNDTGFCGVHSRTKATPKEGEKVCEKTLKKGGQCGRIIKGDTPFCLLHMRYVKEEAEEKKEVEVPISFCEAEVKSGPRKGQVCQAKVKNNGTRCHRHLIKNKPEGIPEVVPEEVPVEAPEV